MIRFRFREDEQRFVRLHAEMFEKIARAGLREGVGSETLRNVGKIEQMAFMEGIRQGLAMAALVNEMVQAETPTIPEPHAQKAFQLHALVYGSSDTPLRTVEKEWLSKLALDEDHLNKSWLDDKPMRFAPATLQELDGTTPPVAPMISVQATAKPKRVNQYGNDPAVAPTMEDMMVTPESIPDQTDDYDPPGRPRPPPEAMHGAEVTVPEPWQKGEYEPDDPADDDKEIQPESPEFLDIARSAIQAMKVTGWDPKTWQEIVLGLHRHMQVDAGYIDLQLTTHVGRAVLDQCGLAGFAPPDIFEFLSTLPNRGGEASSLAEPGEGSMGFGKAHGWEDEK